MLLALFLLVAGVQALTVPADDADRVAGADEIVRGTITDVQSRWNDDHTHIVTTATVTVKSRLKGQGPGTETLIVLGGTADGITEWAEEEPALVPGTEAYVFVRNNAPVGVPADGRVLAVEPVSNGKAPGWSVQKDAGIPVADYDRYLQGLAQGEAVAPPEAVEPVTCAVGVEPVISSVSPNIGSAGTGTTVTIAGAGFGSKTSRESTADVGFFSRYNGLNYTPIWASGAGYFTENSNDIVSWTDTQIVARVPTGRTADDVVGSASSGFVVVVNEKNSSSSRYPFTVTFGYGKAKWNVPAKYYVNPGAVSGAATAIQNAGTTWNTQIPTSSFRLAYQGTSTSTAIGKNGQNLVCFRPASEFSDPSNYGESFVWSENGVILEADIMLNSGKAWTTGTASGDQMNVQAGALHMFGHWLSLRNLYGNLQGYPSDLGKVMFAYNGATFGNQNQKTLHATDIAGIQWIYPPELTVSSISPNSGIQGATVAITNLAGTAFQPGATVRLTRTGQPDIPAIGVAVASSTKITCTLALPLTAATGAWNVTVTNPGGVNASRTGGFTINLPPFTVTSITPNKGAQSETVPVVIAGAGFKTGATVRLARTGQADIAATNVAVASPTTITCTFALPMTAATGAWNVVVTNPDGASATKSSGFTINPFLTVASIAPNKGTQGETVPVTLTGTGFRSGATVKLARTGQADIAATGVIVGSLTTITCTFALPMTATTGAWNVVVTNPDGSSAVKSNGFTVNPFLTVASITPNKGTQGMTVPVTIAGTGFLSGATVKLTKTGNSDIAATGVVVGSLTTISCTLPLPETAATGAWNVVVTNPDGASAVKTSGFTINPALTITSITPSKGTQGMTVPVTIVGTGYETGATVKLARTGQADITATFVVVPSSTTITCTFVLPLTATTGAWNVVVTNPDGASVTKSNGFTVNPFLTITSIAPNKGAQGETVPVTIVGTGYEAGATVRLARTGQADIAATNVAVVSPTTITCALALPKTAATGAWNVVVTNPDGASVVKTSGFTITLPPIAVASITPNTGIAGTTVPVTITGIEFVSGTTTVTLTRSGVSTISATNIVVVSPTTITCTLALPLTAASGSRDVVVTNLGRSATLPGGFTIYPPLTVVSINPNTAVRGTTVPVVISGAEFESGATVTLVRPGSADIAARNVVVPSSVQIACTFTLPSTTLTGAWNVVVTNPDGESVTVPGGLVVFDRPPPDPVTNLRITTTTMTSLGWNWTDPTTADFVAVRVYLNNVELEDVAKGVQVYGRSGLLSDMLYTFSTRTHDSAGNPSTWVNITTRTPRDSTPTPGVLMIPGGVSVPTDTNGDGLYDDVNGNGRKDFADVVLFFNQMTWIAEHEPVAAFDVNRNGRIDFADVVWLFNSL